MSSVGRRRSLVGALCAGLLVVAPVAACGRPDDDVLEARRAAEEATERADELESRLETVTAAVAATQQDLDIETQDRSALARRLVRAAQGLRKSVRQVREIVDEGRQSSETAASNAASALAEVREIAHSLAILKNRYDYHLRQYHGSS
jgi:TolA-binding protein